MKSTRYTEEQIIRILGGVESDKAVATVCRQYNPSEATVHRWPANIGTWTRSLCDDSESWKPRTAG